MGPPWRWGWAQKSSQMSGGGSKKFQMTNLTIPNNISSMKYALKSVPVPPDVEVLPLAVPDQKLIISGSYSLISGKAGIPR